MTTLATRSADYVTPGPPGLDLALTIECTSGPQQRVGTTHRVVVRSDWSVDAAHSFEAERAARSMGGWCSCLYFAETVVPAYGAALRIISGSASASVRGTLSAAGVAALCTGRGWTVDNPDAAAELLAAALLNAAGSRWARWGDPRYVDDAEGSYGALWELGVPPVEVEKLARQLPASSWPLPTAFYEAAYLGRVDDGWLLGAINCYPTREFISWATNQEGERPRIPVESLWRMFDLGLSAEEAISVVEAGVPMDLLSTVASRDGVGAVTAAMWLCLWWPLGVRPGPAHYDALDAEQVLAQPPPSWKLAWTAQSLGRFGAGAPSRTELAVMLALTPDLALIEGAIACGIRSATDIRFTQIIQHKER